ncbi:hypothetical protein QJS10_CPA08g01878 [Acorus calamus]|uniref:Uncharacterized protein n=1 Tax=Acorus calamus TaxID=4465 RepID=A0AAV9EA03_ACOCL|nr:hypothetical protein QJS10_CPA08g01878 [Acorus calamus]
MRFHAGKPPTVRFEESCDVQKTNNASSNQVTQSFHLHPAIEGVKEANQEIFSFAWEAGATRLWSGSPGPPQVQDILESIFICLECCRSSDFNCLTEMLKEKRQPWLLSTNYEVGKVSPKWRAPYKE